MSADLPSTRPSRPAAAQASASASPGPRGSDPRSVRVFLLGPESIAPVARCAQDSLRARGYKVHVVLGRRARRFVRHAPPGPPSLRMLCVPGISAADAHRLAQRGEDFHVMGSDTPREIVEAVEHFTGRSHAHAKARAGRRYLAHPTLIEQQLHAGQRWRWKAAAAVATVALCGAMATWLSAAPSASTRERAASRARRATPTSATTSPTRAEDGAVLSATARPRDGLSAGRARRSSPRDRARPAR